MPFRRRRRSFGRRGRAGRRRMVSTRFKRRRMSRRLRIGWRM